MEDILTGHHSYSTGVSNKVRLFEIHVLLPYQGPAIVNVASHYMLLSCSVKHILPHKLEAQCTYLLYSIISAFQHLLEMPSKTKTG